MTDFNYEKKLEHERRAAESIDCGKVGEARFHIKEAVKHTMVLAQRCGGAMGEAYIANANGLLDALEALKAKSEKSGKGLSLATPNEDASRSGEKISKDVSGNEGSDNTTKGKWTVAADTHVRFDDVIGLEDAKQIVADALINPVKHPDIYKTLKVKPGTGLLLYGPPRTGKTMFGRAIAGELNCAFIYAKADEFVSKYVGDTEKNIAEIFREARSHTRCILFLDDCEDVVGKRGNQKVKSTKQFLVELDGFDKHEESQVFVVLATNRPWAIDPAVLKPGRIPAKVYVGLPNHAARDQIIKKALNGIPLADDVDIGKLVDLTDGYAAGEICHGEGGGGLCDTARTFASRRWVKRREGLKEGSEEWAKVELVTWRDFEDAMKTVQRASIASRDYIERNLAFRDEANDANGAFRGEGDGDED